MPPSPILKAKTLEHLDTWYPRTHWTHVYTDGSSEETIKRGGAVILILTPKRHKNREISCYGGTIYKLHGRTNGYDWACKNYGGTTTLRPKHTSFMRQPDRLQAYIRWSRGQYGKDVMEKLNQFSATNRMVLQWIPACCDIVENETANKLVKEAKKK